MLATGAALGAYKIVAPFGAAAGDSASARLQPMSALTS
jgi:hypothetical protein